MNNKIINILFTLMTSLFLSGCELIGPELHKKLPLQSVVQINATEQSGIIYQEVSNQALDRDDERTLKAEIYPGTGEFINTKAGLKAVNNNEKGQFSLNFDAADLGEVAKVILSDILQKNYVISSKVTGAVTLQTSTPLTRSELLPTLEMLLQLNGAALVVTGGVYQIEPKSDVLSNSAFNVYDKHRQQIPSGYQIKVIPVKNVAVDALAEIIKPLLQDKTILHMDSVRNMMMVAGSGNELNRVMEMVNAFDVDVMKGRSFGLFPIKNVEASTMIEELQQVFNQEKVKSGTGFFQFMEIERLNSILAITHHSKFLKEIERWILRLDRANTSVGGGVIVYRVQHVDAVELAATLNEIFSQSGSKSRAGSASVSAGRKTFEITNKNKTSAKTTNTKIKRGKPSLAGIGEVKIIADEVNNALIIVATAQDYSVVQRVIKQLDVMPLQVLIDATIVDVTLTDNLKYGIKWALSHNGGKNAASSNTGVSLFDTAKKAAVTSATGGFGYAFVSSDISAVLDAEALKDNINIISSPSIMVLNNQEASIQVGNEISLKTSDVANTNSSGTVTTTFQQRKTGVTVNVRPRVNANGLVIIEIEQKVEDFGGSSSGTSGNPDILTREIKSHIAVQSGETIVLGGLINNKNTYTKSGIPFLHELPLIGALFGTTTKETKKTELVVLITPRVVRSKLDARLVTDEFKRKLSGIYDDTMHHP